MLSGTVHIVVVLRSDQLSALAMAVALEETYQGAPCAEQDRAVRPPGRNRSECAATARWTATQLFAGSLLLVPILTILPNLGFPLRMLPKVCPTPQVTALPRAHATLQPPLASKRSLQLQQEWWRHRLLIQRHFDCSLDIGRRCCWQPVVGRSFGIVDQTASVDTRFGQ